MKNFLSILILISFFVTGQTGTCPVYAEGFSINQLPLPGTLVDLSPAYVPVIAKGLRVHPEDPVLFDFIVDTGNSGLTTNDPRLKAESEKLIKYFLAGLTIPEDDLWVNLSPYEKSRIVPEQLGQTVMGRDMLAQDYILKQLTASLIYPEKDLGRKFWDRVYKKSQQLYGSTEIPVNTFNKVWIVADKARVYVHDNTAFVVACHMKVMLEEDYLSLEKHSAIMSSSHPPVGGVRGGGRDTHAIGSQIIRQIILPEIENEVNKGKNFANLRQIYNSMVLAAWYKKNLKEALLNQVYSNKAKINGVDVSDRTIKEQIYREYLKAYKKGVFNYIKEDLGRNGQAVPRKYFSGGELGVRTSDVAMVTRVNPDVIRFLRYPAVGTLLDERFVTQWSNFPNTGNKAMVVNPPKFYSDAAQFSQAIQQQIEEINQSKTHQVVIKQEPKSGRALLELMDLKGKSNMTVMPGYGFNLLSARFNGKEIVADGGVPQMSPWVGRMKNGLMANPQGGGPISLNNLSDQFVDKLGDHPIHGVVDKLPWEVTNIAKEGENGENIAITALFDSRKYPELVKTVGEFTLEITYRLTKDGITFFHIRKNVGQSPIRLEYGLHPWIRGNGDKVLLNFNAKKRVTIDDSGIPTGIVPVDEEYNFSAFKAVNSVPLDFTFTDLQADTNGLVTLKVMDQENNISYTYQWKKDEFPFVHLWNGWGGSFSAEPMTSYAGAGADGVRLEGHETAFMEPGEERHGTFTLEVKMDRAQIAKPENTGGIDLDPKNMQLDTDGQKINIKLDPAMIAQFKREDFTGVRPVIINIQPMKDLQGYLGLNEKQEISA